MVAVSAVQAALHPAADDRINITLLKITFSRANGIFVKAFIEKEPADTRAKMTLARIQL